MATGASTSSHQIDLDALIQSLPACKRCRECRRGCDTQLPRCRQCTKANVECVFWDHGKGKLLPRSYIDKLVKSVRELYLSHPSLAEVETPLTVTSPSSMMAIESPLMMTSQSTMSMETPLAVTPPSTATIQTPSTAASSSTAQGETVESEVSHYEHYYASAGGSYRYLGGRSCLLKSPRLQQAEIKTPVIPDDDDWELVWKGSSKDYDLVKTYLDVVQPLYPFLDTTGRFFAPEPLADLKSAEIFSLNMVCSIACYMQPARNRKDYQKIPDYMWKHSGKLDFHHFASEKYRCLSQNYFIRAMEYLEATTVDDSITTLRAVLLLAVHSLFDPKSGNLGQQVALASRLLLTLQAEMQHTTEMHPSDLELLHNMHSVVFTLENQVASTLDRPTFFPEPPGCDLYFQTDRPSDFLCSLYRLQRRFRNGDLSVKHLLPPFDNGDRMHPGLRMALYETHLLLNPCWGTAFYVLEAVVAVDCIHMCLTPHWVYRAGCVLVQNLHTIIGEDFIQLYANALLVLELLSGRYPNTCVLKDSLEDLVQQMKRKHRPHWESQGLQLYDVRL